MVARRWIPVVGDGSNLYHFIHVDDLTNFMLLLATHPKAEGEVFICGSPSAMTFKEMVSIISQYYGVSVKFIRLPATPLFALGHFFEIICRPLGIEPPIYRRRVAFFTKDRSFDTTKMRQVLEFYPVHSDEEGFKETAQWYLEQGWLSV
jgi:nucleoside-diphosphate-sugar epimerase